MMIDKITRFKDEYAFLSNFYPASVTYKGITYASSEHAYQAQKCINEDDKLQFIGITPGQAKRLGSTVKSFNAWDDIRVQVMYEILSIKFADKHLSELLLATGNTYLVEGNYHNDAFWGYDLKKNKGENVLGNVLMYIRYEHIGVSK